VLEPWPFQRLRERCASRRQPRRGALRQL
jgi:hypothetical protein